MSDEKLLAKHGWTETCQSPYELTHEDGSFASGIAAWTVRDDLKNAAKRKKKRRKGLESSFKVYDLLKSPNGNLFLKISENYSIALGPKGGEDPREIDLIKSQYIKSSKVAIMKKVGKLKFN